MICVSINEKNYNDAIEVASLYNFAEIRLDLLGTVDNGVAEKIFSSHKNLIATYRRKDGLDAKRLSIIKAAIGAGAAYVDVDINESNEFISSVELFCKTLCRQSSEKKTSLIISYHNYEETPHFDVLDKIVIQAVAKGADVVKIACAVNEPAHVERLLGLPEHHKSVKIVIAGMGEYGGRVRILSEASGSFFTYASHDMESCTAEGQLDYKTIVEERRKIVSGL
ncbi:MAG: type I 3-dehydroquinate dehydratase [Spirochaetes bacterium]|nr:type I 3-dehydroquinate dehydratase [Spirochaetota bacterium]